MAGEALDGRRAEERGRRRGHLVVAADAAVVAGVLINRPGRFGNADQRLVEAVNARHLHHILPIGSSYASLSIHTSMFTDWELLEAKANVIVSCNAFHSFFFVGLVSYNKKSYRRLVFRNRLFDQWRDR